MMVFRGLVNLFPLLLVVYPGWSTFELMVVYSLDLAIVTLLLPFRIGGAALRVRGSERSNTIFSGVVVTLAMWSGLLTLSVGSLAMLEPLLPKEQQSREMVAEAIGGVLKEPALIFVLCGFFALQVFTIHSRLATPLPEDPVARASTNNRFLLEPVIDYMVFFSALAFGVITVVKFGSTHGLTIAFVIARLFFDLILHGGVGAYFHPKELARAR